MEPEFLGAAMLTRHLRTPPLLLDLQPEKVSDGTMRQMEKGVRAMDREGVNQIMLKIFNPEGGIKRWNFDQGKLADLMLDDLARQWDGLPDTTKAVMLGVAHELKMRSMEQESAGEMAALLVDRVMQQSRVTR
jgi:hypothetical protein